MTILLHSSKTMKIAPSGGKHLRQPQLMDKTLTLQECLLKLSVSELMRCMHLSKPLAEKTHHLIQIWSADQKSLAIDTFLGDIYSGLHATDLSKKDRDYADTVLLILSGLYGCIRAYDGICPYRLEMGYHLPSQKFSDLYSFWGSAIADCLPKKGTILNLAAVEYAKTVTPFVDRERIVTPHFLTIKPETNEPTFVVVHAKIARGAFARFVITKRIEEREDLKRFTDLGYIYNKALSTPDKPTFVCNEFGGKGLSIRLLNS